MVAGIYNYDGKSGMEFHQVENDTLITEHRQTQGWARERSMYFSLGGLFRNLYAITVAAMRQNWHTAIFTVNSTPRRISPEMSGRKTEDLFQFRY
ncbi:MAG: hypothetical protein U0Z17_02325 [Bacteroidales bacterium]